MTKVFVTGASGFIAKHILRELLEKGYDVRASVRSDKRKDELQGLFPDATLEFATLDLTKDEGWHDALQGCDVLIHTASPFPLTEPKDPQDLIRPAVDGTLRAMRAAKDAEIKRVILTSSCAAIYKQAGKPKMTPSDETNWTSPDDPSVGAYEASKTLAEKAAWDFVAETPGIALTTINPGAVFGPPMDARYGSSLELVEQLMTGKVPIAPPIDMVAVDVRDVARMHVAAIELEATKGERFAAVSGTHSFLEFGEILKRWDSNLKTPGREAPVWLLRIMGLFSKDVKAVLGNVGRTLAVSGAKAEKTFGFEFIPVKEALIVSAEAVKKYKLKEKEHMITAYLWGTPNGYKVAIALEEMGLDYEITWVNIGAGEQHEPAFLKLSPNGKIPAILDHETGISLMESGAILQYLAERTGRFGGETTQDRWTVTQWLHWQMGGLGPIMGQANHFRGLKDKVPYGETRYMNEAVRLFGVLDRQLEGRDYITGKYSIADMATVPWAGMAQMMGDDRLTAHANVVAWIERNVARPATTRALTLSPG